MRISKKAKNVITSVLVDVYALYKTKGILAIYLWGSVTSDEYNSKKSDIDTIAIVSDAADETDVPSIRAFLKEKAPQLRNFKLNYLYQSELQAGKAYSKIGRWMDPRILLLDFKQWEYVVGKRFRRTEFRRDISFAQAIAIQIKSLQRQHFPRLEQKDFAYREYFCKYVMKICHYLNQQYRGKHPFGYRTLATNSPPESKMVAQALLQIRKNGWSLRLFKQHLALFLQFLHDVQSFSIKRLK